ncbi:hypothetical protein GRJ2_003504300 [Grus japonensis]|uniref:Rna-directed dna polymerase from mobile element jockey-like n=1 Tax=Grus japonensis TaxID=30415 RepID=A0ABC9YJX5_GRUJA
MDHSVDKELAGWSRSKSCGQWLNVQVEISDEWCSSGVSTGTRALVSIFVGNTDSGIACALSKFADDTKLCGVDDTLEGRDAVQRNLDRPERWACANRMKFNKAKCKVLHVGRGNPKHNYRLGREWIESSPEEEDSKVLIELKAQHEPAMRASSPESQPCPGLHQKKGDQQVEGGDPAPLLRSGETPPGVLHPALEAPVQERHGAVGVSPEEGHEGDRRAGAPHL